MGIEAQREAPFEAFPSVDFPVNRGGWLSAVLRKAPPQAGPEDEAGTDPYIVFTDMTQEVQHTGSLPGSAEGETVLLRMPETAGRGSIRLESLQTELSQDLSIDAFPAVIGSKQPPAQILVKVPGVSRSHALVEYEEGSFLLSDLHSKNGTFVNGKRLIPDRRQQIGDKDQIRFGQTAFTVRL